MTNQELLKRIGCESCDYTGTKKVGGIYDVCECVPVRKERGLDEDNYMELQGIKSN